MIDKVLRAYIECAVWATPECAGVETADDLAPEALASAREDCESFLDLAEGLDLTRLNPEQIGHDIWLSRNRHGAGFWDRGLGALGDKLHEIAVSLGTCDLYTGDDGFLYFN